MYDSIKRASWFAVSNSANIFNTILFVERNLAKKPVILLSVKTNLSTSSFIDYKADVEAPLPMICQSGYLTIKDWNMDTDSYLLDFPNDEVRSGFLTLVKAAKRR